MEAAALARPAKPVLAVNVSHRTVLRLSVPMMFAFMSTPTVGLVDIALMGRSGSASLIGGVAIATIIFEVILALVSFLRAGTTGLTAQAFGAKDLLEERAVLFRAVLVAAALGAVVVALADSITNVGLLVFRSNDAEVEGVSRLYLSIRILAAPLTLINLVIWGWLLGRGEAVLTLFLQLWLNLVNIAVSSFLVIAADWGAAGAAWGTVSAELATTMVSVVLLWRRLRGSLPAPARVFAPKTYLRLLSLNVDIMVRSFALLVCFSFFTQQSAAMGAVVLAANTMLMRLCFVGSAALDGIAMAAEQLAGLSVGANNRWAFERVLVVTGLWGIATAAALSASTFLLGPSAINFLSSSEEVRSTALELLPLASLMPLFGVTAFQMDGIFAGATWSRDMRNLMLLSMAAYFAAWAVLVPAMGAGGLWAAILTLHATRSVAFRLRLRSLVPRTFS